MDEWKRKADDVDRFQRSVGDLEVRVGTMQSSVVGRCGKRRGKSSCASRRGD